MALNAISFLVDVLIALVFKFRTLIAFLWVMTKMISNRHFVLGEKRSWSDILKILCLMPRKVNSSYILRRSALIYSTMIAYSCTCRCKYIFCIVAMTLE